MALNVSQIQVKDKYRLVSEIARRRGFFWGSFEIYGGVSGFLDLGPYGVALRKLLEDEWRNSFLRPHGFLEVSTPIITPSKVLEASGHVANFKDPMTECENCKRRFRADQVVKDATGIETEGLSLDQLGKLLKEKNVRCPECGGQLGQPEYFHTMFKTTIGPYGEDVAYGRPEAAQGVFINFRRLMEVSRERFPIGIAQIGTALRNEISPRRIVKASWAAYFMALAKRFLNTLGIPSENQRFLEKLSDERAHYSAQTFDLEVRLDRWGWVEVAGFAYRTDYDLKSHMIASGTDMRVFRPYEKPIEKTTLQVKPNYQQLRAIFGNDAGRVGGLLASADPEKLAGKTGPVELDGFVVPRDCFELKQVKAKEAGAKFLPHVIEPSFGVERLVYATLEYSLRMNEDRVILSIPPKLAPVQAAIFPLLGKDGLPEKAMQIFTNLSAAGLRVEYDEAGSIGRRYARADEAGIPIGITVDYDTMKDGTVTLRDRDTWKQLRRPTGELSSFVRKIVENGFQSIESEP